MAKQKQDTEYTDAKGNLHKQFADGRSEIYIGGFDKTKQYVEVTDGADKMVHRKRFLPYIEPPFSESLVTNDPEIATRTDKQEAKSKSAADSFMRDRTK